MTARSPLAFALAFGLVACAAGSPPAGPAAPPPVAEPPPPDPEPDPNTPGQSPPADPQSPSGGEPGFPGASWRVSDLGVSVPDAWRSCGAASDCTLVVTTCCDHCNGGKAVAVNAKHAKDVAAKYPKNCQNVACTERGCMTRASCQDSRCVMEWQTAVP